MNKFQAIKNPNVNEQAHQEVEAMLNSNFKDNFSLCQIQTAIPECLRLAKIEG